MLRVIIVVVLTDALNTLIKSVVIVVNLEGIIVDCFCVIMIWLCLLLSWWLLDTFLAGGC
jgi:hypothetical protein